VLKWTIFPVIFLNCWGIVADTTVLSPDTLTIENSDISNYLASYENEHVCGLFALFLTFIAIVGTTLIFIGIVLTLLGTIIDRRSLKRALRLIGVILILAGLLIIIKLKSELP